MPKFNTMFDVAFTVEHDCEDTSELTAETLIAALQRRIYTLRSESPEAAREAFGECDTYSTPGEHCPDEGCPGVIEAGGTCSHCGEDFKDEGYDAAGDSHPSGRCDACATPLINDAATCIACGGPVSANR